MHPVDMRHRVHTHLWSRETVTWLLAVLVGMVDATAAGFPLFDRWWFACALMGPALGAGVSAVGLLVRRPLPGATTALIWSTWSLTVEVFHL